MKVEINCHSSVKLIGDKIIYIDPFRITENINDADIIFFTHDHYDHMSDEDIEKVIKADTLLVAPSSCLSKLNKFANEVLAVLPNRQYDISFFLQVPQQLQPLIMRQTIPAAFNQALVTEKQILRQTHGQSALSYCPGLFRIRALVRVYQLPGVTTNINFIIAV